MRTRNEIRENGFVVARQYLADAGARDRPIGPVYQLHLDVLDLLLHAEADAERLAEKDVEIERLREDAGDEVDRLQVLISAGEAEIARLRNVLEDIVYEEDYSRMGYESKSKAHILAEGGLQ